MCIKYETMADPQLDTMAGWWEGEDQELESDQLRRALTDIACEIQRFLNCRSSPESDFIEFYQDGPNDECEDAVGLRKAKLKSKEQVIRSLKDHLSTACMIAKTALAAKENDIKSYNNNLSSARNESADSLKKNTEFLEEMQKLIDENQTLNDKLKNMSSFIELGYLELKKMQNEEEDANELPVLMQLKKIMVCCGQYFADYSNEREKSLQLEQKNRYLTNKLTILENSLEAVTEELKKFKCQKTMGKKNPKEKKSENNRTKNIGFVCSDIQIGQNQVARTSTMKTYSIKSVPSKDSEVCRNTVHNVDLTSHLTLVRSLLKDQDVMLQDLKKLSYELESIT